MFEQLSVQVWGTRSKNNKQLFFVIFNCFEVLVPNNDKVFDSMYQMKLSEKKEPNHYLQFLW